MKPALLTALLLATPFLAPGKGIADSHAAPSPEQILRGAAAQAGVDFDALVTADDPEPTLVSIHFDYTMPDAAFEAEMSGSAPFLAQMPGLTWKVWSWDEETNTANGTYLFASRAAAEFYVNIIFPAGPPSREGYGSFTISMQDVLVGASLVTRAALD